MIKLKMSDLIADMIIDMFEDGRTVQIQRNDLAGQIGCAPSQINYVISSRFTPEQGYRIESRRGGGGYILITRAENEENALISLINSVGDAIDEKTVRSHIYNFNHQKIIDDKFAKMFIAATSDSNLKMIEPELRNIIRANIFKQMLLAYID